MKRLKWMPLEFNKMNLGGNEMRKFKSVFSKMMIVAMLMTQVFQTSASTVCAANATAVTSQLEGIGSIETCDLSNFDNWRTGCYSYVNGAYEGNSKRICLKEYKTFAAKSFKAEISQSKYKLLIRELDKNGSFIQTATVANADTYKPSSSAKYLAISLYDSSWEESKKTYEVFKSLFAAGLTVKLTAIKTETSVTTPDNSTTSDSDNNQQETTDSSYIENVEFTDITNWRTGDYYYQTGEYTTNVKRLCLTGLKLLKNEKYTAKLSDSNYHLLVRELDSNKKLTASHDMASGESFTKKSSTKYLAVGVYNKASEWGITYDTYKKLFKSGFTAKLAVATESDTDTKDDVVIDTSTSTNTNNSTQTTTKDSETLFRKLILEMVLTGDTATHDISQYNLKYGNAYLIYEDVIENEAYLAFNSYYDLLIGMSQNSNHIVQTVYLRNVDSGFADRYVKMQNVVAKALGMLSPEMGDVEKALILHDYVVENTTYVSGAEGSSTAAGCLVNGQAICSGYANGLETLLHEAGIKSYHIVGNYGYHSWIMAQLDGQWYHIDPTWDYSTKGQAMHTYFVRNDQEYKSGCPKKHSQWKSYEFDATSTSTKYTDWFVHDVVGKMIYSNGYWYYADGNQILKSKIDGTQKSVVATEDGKITIQSGSKNTITYKVGSEQTTISL